MDHFKNLPSDITLDILSRVPTESVLECKLVSKTWRCLIHQPSFSKMHFYRSSNASVDSGELGFLAISDELHYLEYNEESTPATIRIRRINLTSPIRDTDFVDSCNGLICFAGGPCVWICNPITRECVMLPDIIERDSPDDDWVIKFGYASSTDEYKLVGVLVMDPYNVEVYVYTLGSGNGWRKLGIFNFLSGKIWHQGVFANGTLYWLDTEFNMILTFDLAEEEFSENLSPPPLPTGVDRLDSNISIRVGVLDGFLFIGVSPGIEEGGCFFDIWLLNKKSVNGEMNELEEHQSSVWSREFRIDNSKLSAVTKTDGVLTYVDNYLNIFEMKTSTSKRLVNFNDWLRQVSPHKNTFVSLKELGEEDTETMESVEIEETRTPGYVFEQLQEDAKLEYV